MARGKLIAFPAPVEEPGLPWSDWIVSLLKTEPARIFDEAERAEWYRLYREQKSAARTKPTRKRARR